MFDTLRRLRLFWTGERMNTAEGKKLVQIIGAICALIGNQRPAIGLAFALAELAQTPEQVQKIADAAARIIERKEQGAENEAS